MNKFDFSKKCELFPKNEWFGKTLILNEDVICVDPTKTDEQKEDLELFRKCCEDVCKLYKEIGMQ